MYTTKAQQIALDDALVAPANRLKIGKCNHQLSSTLKSNEPTLQVVLDALKLTPCYKAFQITVNVPKIYMHEFWATVSIHHTSLCFKMNDKSHTLNLENFNYMLQICPKLPGRKFKDPPIEEEILSFIRDLGHTREIKVLTDVNVNNMHQPWRSFAAIINRCLSGKTTDLDSLCLLRAQIIWGMYHKKDVDYVYLLWEDLSGKKRRHASVPKAKGLVVLSEVALTEAEQIKMATKRSKKHVTHDDEVSSNQRVYTPPDHQLTDEEENPEGDDEVNEGEDEQQEEEELYGDLNINLQRSDAEMTDAQQENVQANQVTKDTHMTLTTTQTLVNVPVSIAAETPFSDTTIPQPHIPNIQNLQQTPESTPTTSILTTTLPDIPNFASLFQFDQWVSTLETELFEFRQTNQFVEAISSIIGIVDNYLASKMKEAVDVTSYVVATSLLEFELKKILIDKIEENQSVNRSDIQKNLYNALVESYNSEKDIFSSYGDVVTLKRGRDDQDNDEDPSAGSNRGSKRRRSGKEAESSKEPTHKESKSTTSSKVDDLEEQIHQEFNTGNDDVTPVQEALDDDESKKAESSKVRTHKESKSTSSSKGTSRPQPKSLDKSAHVEEHGEKVDDLEDQPHYKFNTGNDDVALVREAQDVDERQWNPSSSATPDCEWHKTKIIEEKVSRIWSPVKVVYDKHAYWGTYHWGPKCQKFYGYASNMETSKDVYSRHKIVVDGQLYKFREGDFKRLRRQDIEDMLLLLVQSKLFNLNLEERYALNVALRMFTRRIVIKERAEDLQLGVESYQKKINLKKPDTYRSYLKRMNPYTAYPDIQGIIYEDETNRNRLMRTDELYKFNDGTLNHVRTALNDIATGIEMEYLPKRK
nr:hypothetical protein [Tanacetum cinerariifolium]